MMSRAADAWMAPDTSHLRGGNGLPPCFRCGIEPQGASPARLPDLLRARRRTGSGGLRPAPLRLIVERRDRTIHDVPRSAVTGEDDALGLESSRVIQQSERNRRMVGRPIVPTQDQATAGGAEFPRDGGTRF